MYNYNKKRGDIMEKNIQWMSKKEISERVKRTETTIDRWRRLGCPCRQFAGQVQFDPEAVEEWVLNNPQLFQVGRSGRWGNSAK